MNNNEENKNNGLFIGILLMVLAILVFFFAKINSLINPKKSKAIGGSNTKIEEKKEVSEEVLESLHYPIMRNSVYSAETYYKLNKFSISNMSNNDILYNAFMDMYEGNIVSGSKRGKCTKDTKEFNSEYMTLRIKNILGKNVKYNFDSFYVPEDTTSNYKGEWSYNSGKFIYEGLCSSKVSSTKYYDLKQFIKAEYNKSDVIVYYYVGFAKIDGSNYTIYKDANLKEELTKGTGDNLDMLNQVFEGIDKNKKKIYKYTFKNSLCSYNEYCLYTGEYVSEL